MNKPSWNDAPEWANWLAQDRNGQWFWHENIPVVFDDEGEWKSLQGGMKVPSDYEWTRTRECLPPHF